MISETHIFILQECEFLISKFIFFISENDFFTKNSFFDIKKFTFCQESWHLDENRGVVTKRTTPSGERLEL